MPTVYSVLEDDEVRKILAFIRSVYAGDSREDRLVEAPRPGESPELPVPTTRCPLSAFGLGATAR